MTIYKAKNGTLINMDAVTAIDKPFGSGFTVHLVGGATLLLAEEHYRFTESWINEFDAEILEK